jgi:hypothetical protein
MEKRVRILELLVVGLFGMCVGLALAMIRTTPVSAQTPSGIAATSMGDGRVVIATPSKYMVVQGPTSGKW